MEAIVQGKPSPRKTFTELDPVIFPIAESALSLLSAAILEAIVSGRDVPKATKVIAVTACLSLIAQPSKLAISPTIAVQRPIIARAKKNAGQPWRYLLGGIIAKKMFHPIEKK
jgi:hypothetical protein